MMETVLQDIRYGIRMLARNPGFTAVAVLTLALGIGANTAIFTIVNAVLLNPLPVTDAAHLFELDTTDRKTTVALGNATRLGMSVRNYEDFARQADVFSGITGFMGIGLTQSGGDAPKRFQGSLVTANYFDVLGVRAVLGRTFRPDEDQNPGGDTVAVVSYGFWSREFGSSPEVPGKRLTLNGTDYTVIGVTPPQFKGTFLFANSDQIWLPISMHTQVLAGFIEDHFLDRRFLDLNTVGRLKAGVTVRQAESAVETIASRLEQQYPKDNQGRGATLSPVPDASLGINQHAQVVKAGVVMMGIVGVVLLIACVNLASLMLSQTARREKEMCLRAALGAGSRRLARQSLTESFLLSMLGGAVGLLLGYWGRWALWSERPAFLRQSDLALPLDGRVWAFTFAIAVLTAILFGLVPAWKVSRPTLMETLNSGGRSGSMAWGRSRFRQALVVSEVALALVALVGAALFLRSFAFAQGLDPGFESKRLFVMGFDLGSQHYDQDRGEQYFRDAIERAASSPGVQSAAVASNFPLGGGVGRTIFLEGQDAESGHRGTLTTLNDVSSGYFQTLGIPLHHGRAFNDLDRKETKPVAIVNHAMAKHFWPGESPLGKRFHFIGEMRLLEVVGEVGDSWQFGVGEDPQPVAYLPITQAYSPFAVLQVRTMGDPKTVLPSVRESVQSIDRNLAFVGVSTIGGLLDQGLWAPRMGAFLMGAFGLLALLLATVGIYGVLSYSVTQRTQEVGIRVALGAAPASVRGLIVKQGMTLVAIGVGIGVVGSVGLARLMTSLLFGVKASDPLTFAAATFVLAAVAFVATYLPARRATKVDPVVALRHE
jgi:predicted permease